MFFFHFCLFFSHSPAIFAYWQDSLAEKLSTVTWQDRIEELAPLPDRKKWWQERIEFWQDGMVGPPLKMTQLRLWLILRDASNFPTAYVLSSFADLCFTTYLLLHSIFTSCFLLVIWVKNKLFLAVLRATITGILCSPKICQCLFISINNLTRLLYE